MITPAATILAEISARDVNHRAALALMYLPGQTTQALNSISKVETAINGYLNDLVTDPTVFIPNSVLNLSIDEMIRRNLNGLTPADVNIIVSLVMADLTANHADFLADYAAYHPINLLIAAGYEVTTSNDGITVAIS